MMKVLLGVTGCIATYKSCEILRLLQKRGADVEVIMTENAAKFVGPQTFSALSGHPAKVSNFDDMQDSIPHIRMAQECDLFLIAPCTGNMMAKIACGIADDLVSTCALAAHGKLVIAPAMNTNMYMAPSTQSNLKKLFENGAHIIEPQNGRLACGDVGPGKLAEVEEIANIAMSILEGSMGDSLDLDLDLTGKRAVITAGATRERIDPVRFISNDSSGKMGVSIANAAFRRGAQVTLVLGHSDVRPYEGVKVIDVVSAEDMAHAVEMNFDECDFAVFCAAVCDMRPSDVSPSKLKKGIDDDALSRLDLEPTVDILKTFAKKKDGRYVVGFAAETDDVVENGRSKLVEKGADLIVANEVGGGKTFGKDLSKAYLIDAKAVKELDEMPKRDLADVILDVICANIT